MNVLARPAGWGGLATLVLLSAAPGCSFGPKAVYRTRLPYNEAVKTTSEEQLLLNIVRLRYSDNPSSIAVSSIAAQFELAKKLQPGAANRRTSVASPPQPTGLARTFMSDPRPGLV